MSRYELEYDAGLAHHLLAAKYLRAAKILYAATISEEKLDITVMVAEYEPLVFLCSHSMELNFKAYLIAYGAPINQVEAFGHDLGKLARECYAEGMALPEWAKAPIDIANAIFSRSKLAPRRDFRARYPRKPTDGPTELLFPNFTVRTAEVVSELAGSAAKQRASIVRSRHDL
jgi:hypothetical protein